MDINEVFKKLGEKIIRYREERKMSQGELSAKVGISKSRLTEIELGKRNLTIETLEKFVKAFNVELYELLDID